MKRNVCSICTLLLSLVLHYGCSEESSHIKDNNGFQLSMDEGVTRSPENEAILDNMRLYCFSQGGNPLSGNGGSWDSQFDNQILGVTRTGMTLHSNAVKAGDWDLVMVSAANAVFAPPVSAKKSSEALMYTYDPGVIQGDGSRKKAHEIWYRMLRLPTINSGGTTNASTGITRNVSMVKVVVDRAVDIDVNPTAEHKFELHGVPDKISWSGTLLKTTGPGTYETSKDNPDVLTQPLTGKLTFSDNSIVETGTYKSDTLYFVIPAHREASFWANNTTPDANIADQDTLVHKMSVAVSFTKASGGKFEKTADITRATRCNGILLVRLRMKDVNLELNTSVTPWEDQSIDGDAKAPYLNVSDVETTVYDGAASRVYFWSNQPADDIYILKEGDGISNVDAVFDRISGKDAVNRYYDPATKSGYIDIANLNLAASQTDVKIYLKAGSLHREIMVKRSVSTQVLKNITTPYIGTFHRADQVGERVVTWKYTGQWTAYVEGPAANDVVIDRLPSPAFSDGTLYSASPSDAEMGIMSNDVTSVTGMNTIYFRVGWKSMTSAVSDPRYATITVRQGTNNPSGTVIQRLYLRQGEKASTVYASGRTNPARFSPYNLTATAFNAAIGVAQGIFTEYPTQSGAYFQWMDHINVRYAYPTTGTATPWNPVHPFYETYWTEESPGMNAIYETCPTGYRRVSDGATNGEPTGTSELRQSLWVNPAVANATNTLTGYYADGFFDRHAIISSATGTVNSAVVLGSTLAYKGRLFYNETTNASLFFPAAGQRRKTDGVLVETGVKGYYWTASSTIKTAEPTSSQAYVSTRLRNTAVSIRCVAKSK